MSRSILIAIAIALGAGVIGYIIGINNGNERRIFFPEDDTASTKLASKFRSGEPINYYDAKVLYDTYTDRWEGNKEYRTRSLWFNYHNILTYLSDLQTELGKAGYDTSQIGVKIYLASDPRNIERYRYRLTSFIVPTVDSAGRVEWRKDTLDISIAKDSARFNDRDKLIKFTDGFNHGDLCPPKTTCGTTIFE